MALSHRSIPEELIKTIKRKKEYSSRICEKVVSSYLKHCETQSRQQISSQLEADVGGTIRATR